MWVGGDGEAGHQLPGDDFRRHGWCCSLKRDMLEEEVWGGDEVTVQ